MTKASIMKIEHAPSTAGQFQPVIEMSVFPASPDRAGAGKGRLSRLSNNSVQGVALLSMLGLAACSSDIGVYLDGGGSLPGGGAGAGGGTPLLDAGSASFAGGEVTLDAQATGLSYTAGATTDAIESAAETAAQTVAENITTTVDGLIYNAAGANILYKEVASSNQSKAGFANLPGGKASSSYDDSGNMVNVEYMQKPLMMALLEQPVINSSPTTSVDDGAPSFNLDLSTIEADFVVPRISSTINEIGLMVSLAPYSISSPYNPYAASVPLYRPMGNERQANVDPANKLGAYVKNIIGSGSHDFIRGNDSDNEIYGRAGADNLHGGVGDDTLNGGPGDDNLSGDLGNDILNGGAVCVYQKGRQSVGIARGYLAGQYIAGTGIKRGSQNRAGIAPPAAASAS